MVLMVCYVVVLMVDSTFKIKGVDIKTSFGDCMTERDDVVVIRPEMRSESMSLSAQVKLGKEVWFLVLLMVD